MKKLYALLVGINDYLPPVSPLSGCIPDIHRISEYLNEYEKENFELYIEMLSNAEAIRDNVIALFKTHLAKATKDDVVLFYYSGHGAQEKADTDIWHFESDKKLEGLVLYDSVPSDYTKSRLLADKELRYLLHYASSFDENGSTKNEAPHILVITDCCHSGENTRNPGLLNSESPIPRQVTSKSGQAFPMRAWEDFCFSKNISPDDLKTKPIDEVLPSVDHVAMAACQSFEKAWEVGGLGVFTKNLIQILERSNGAVTYQDLRSRIRNYIKGQHPQVPQIYTNGNPANASKSFLGRNAQSQPLYANIVYNSKQGWLMDMGAVHGISRQVAESVNVKGKDGATFIGYLKKVHSTNTELVFKGDSKPAITESYKGAIQHFLSAPVLVYINNPDFNETAEDHLKKLIAKNSKNLHLVEDESKADYTIQILFDYYAITKPNDPNKPLVLPEKTNKIGAQQTYDYLQHISQFDYIKYLENTGSNQLSPQLVQFDIFQTMPNGEDELLNINHIKGQEIINCSYTEEHWLNGKSYPKGDIKIKLTNTSRRPLYVALVYMSNDFQSFTQLVNGVQYLQSNDHVWAINGNAIGLNYEDHIQILNLPSTDIDFKIIISEQQIDISHFELKALPTFGKLVNPDRNLTPKGGLNIGDTTTRSGDAWTTRLVTLKIKNPNHNLVTQSDLNSWLASAGGPFIENIYLMDSQPFGGGESVLKEGIQWKETEKERGLLYNLKLKLANGFSKKIRHKRYKKIRAERPHLPVIVSEGDSWFQYPHPALKEIIDHLMNHFAVRSLGAGGDTLVNYFREGELFKVLEEEQPQFLLLSGGGNDILGEAVKKLIADHISEDEPEGKNAGRFLNEKFDHKIEQICKIYKTIFDRIKKDYPDLQVICHGYDYILPNPEKGWFAKHIKDKIKRPGDQKALADFLIDSFNDEVIKVANIYPNVHFLDNRNVVRPHLWQDEIHPNSTGFLDVALKFHQKINELRAGS